MTTTEPKVRVRDASEHGVFVGPALDQHHVAIQVGGGRVILDANQFTRVLAMLMRAASELAGKSGVTTD